MSLDKAFGHWDIIVAPLLDSPVMFLSLLAGSTGLYPKDKIRVIRFGITNTAKGRSSGIFAAVLF